MPEDAAGDIEVPRQLVETGDGKRPLGVDPRGAVVVVGDVATGAGVAAHGDQVHLVGRIDAAFGDVAHLLLPVVPGDGAVRHPLVGETFGQLEFHAVVSRAVVGAVGLEGAVAVRVRNVRHPVDRAGHHRVAVDVVADLPAVEERVVGVADAVRAVVERDRAGPDDVLVVAVGVGQPGDQLGQDLLLDAGRELVGRRSLQIPVGLVR